MALQLRNLTATETDVARIKPRILPKRVETMVFAAGSGTLKVGTPLAKNLSTGYLVKWAKPTQAVHTVSVTTGYTSGNITFTVDGQTTGNVAHDANAAAVLAAINALPNVRPGDFTVAALTAGGLDQDGGGFVITATSTGNFRGRVLVITITSSLAGGAGIAIATTTAGVEANGTDIPSYFIVNNDLILSSAGEVQGVVMLEGDIHIDDIEGVASSDLADFKWAAAKYLRSKGIFVENLTNIV